MNTPKKLREAFFKDKNLAIMITLKQRRLDEFSRYFYDRANKIPHFFLNKFLYGDLFESESEIRDFLEKEYFKSGFKKHLDGQGESYFLIDPITLKKISDENKTKVSLKDFIELEKKIDIWVDENRELKKGEIRINSLDWYNKHKDKNGDVYKYGIYAKEEEDNLFLNNSIIFTEKDIHLCGRIGEVVGTSGDCSLSYLDKIRIMIRKEVFSLHRSCFEGDEIPETLKEKYGVKEEIKKEVLLKYNKIKKKIKYLELPKLLKTKNYGKFRRSNH